MDNSIFSGSIYIFLHTIITVKVFLFIKIVYILTKKNSCNDVPSWRVCIVSVVITDN